MTWRDSLPCSVIELWVIRIFIVAAVFMAGVGTGYILNANKFQTGVSYALSHFMEIANRR